MNRLTKMRQRQKGMSSFGWIAVAGIFGFLVITFFKVFPMYYTNYKVATVLEGLQNDTTIDSKSKREIWTALNKRLHINEVKKIKRENVKMDRKDGKTTVTVTYRIEDQYIGNLFIGGSFVEIIVIDR